MSEDAAPGGADDRAELAATLAHEIRGPVTTLRGLAGTALTHYEGLSDEERWEFLRLIRTEADRLERAVEQVALAMRIDAGAIRPRPRRHDVVALVRAAADAEDVGAHLVEVRAEGALEAEVDASHLTTVVRELVRNAASFSPPDAPIDVAVTREGDDALIEVRDRGPGIPPERRDEVVRRFAAWRPAGYETVPGTGLGLFIAGALVRLLGGSISITDPPQGGTMLAVRLPLEGATESADDDAADL